MQPRPTATFATGRGKFDTLVPLYEQIFPLSNKAIELSKSCSSKPEVVQMYWSIQSTDADIRPCCLLKNWKHQMIVRLNGWQLVIMIEVAQSRLGGFFQEKDLFLPLQKPMDPAANIPQEFLRKLNTNGVSQQRQNNLELTSIKKTVDDPEFVYRSNSSTKTYISTYIMNKIQ